MAAPREFQTDQPAARPAGHEPRVLRTARLLLRPPTVDDADAYFAMTSHPEFALFGARGPADRASMVEALKRIIAAPWATRSEFAITWDAGVIGRIVLDIDRANLVATLGYGIAREHWGRGLATEAARAVVDYAFTERQMAKVAARVDPRNVGSVRVLEKLGMELEGVLRSHVIRWGSRADRALYGLLREDWERWRGDDSER